MNCFASGYDLTVIKAHRAEKIHFLVTIEGKCFKTFPFSITVLVSLVDTAPSPPPSYSAWETAHPVGIYCANASYYLLDGSVSHMLFARVEDGKNCLGWAVF